jgi:hypothetical protein
MTLNSFKRLIGVGCSLMHMGSEFDAFFIFIHL